MPATGERVWHFQMVHHDLWDYDNNVAPILMDLEVEGRPGVTRAVVQLTKQAMAYAFDRVTGEPIWPIVERPVPGSDTPGEWISPTQPFPTKPLPFDRHGITEDDLIDFTPELRAEALEIVEPYILGEIFTPPSVRGDGPEDTRGTLQLPGSVGGAEWGGAGFDPETGMLYVPSVTGAFAADLTPGNPDRMNVRYTRGTRAFPDGPRGLPLTRPPYGRITAIDMKTGEHVWMVPNGDGPRNHPAIAHLDLPPLGQPGRSMTLLTKTLLFVSEGDPIMVRTPPGAGPDAGPEAPRLRQGDRRSASGRRSSPPAPTAPRSPTCTRAGSTSSCRSARSTTRASGSPSRCRSFQSAGSRFTSPPTVEPRAAGCRQQGRVWPGARLVRRPPARRRDESRAARARRSAGRGSPCRLSTPRRAAPAATA